MNEQELNKFLKANLRINIDYDKWDTDGNVYKISLTVNDEEICYTTFTQDYNNNIKL